MHKKPIVWVAASNSGPPLDLDITTIMYVVFNRDLHYYLYIYYILMASMVQYICFILVATRKHK